jgi:hypothetical protein
MPDASPMSQNFPSKLTPVFIGFLDTECEKSSLNGHSVAICRVQERFWGCQSVPIRLRVLAYFNPQWPKLNFAVV